MTAVRQWDRSRIKAAVIASEAKQSRAIQWSLVTQHLATQQERGSPYQFQPIFLSQHRNAELFCIREFRTRTGTGNHVIGLFGN